MEKLIAIQSQRLAQLSKAISNYTKDGKGRKTLYNIEKRIKATEDLYLEAKESHKEILELWTGVQGEEAPIPYFKEDLFGEIENKTFNFVAELHEVLETLVPNKTDESETVLSTGIRLPRIELPHFKGDYEGWVSFRDLFTSLIIGKNLSDVQKMHYLKSSVLGEAAILLRPYNITADNYKIAWQVLVERYENKRVLLNTQFKKLLEQPMAVESALGIRRLLDTTLEAIKAIENLAINDIWDILLVYVVTQRLPIETRQLWEQHVSTVNRLPNFDQAKLFLENRFRALEAISPNQRIKRPQIPKMQSYHVQQQQQQVCVICSENHNIRKCPTFLNFEFDDRFSTTKRNGLCLNCLTKGHLVSQCTSKVSCATCNRRHHVLLHRDTAGNPVTSRFPENANTRPFQPLNHHASAPIKISNNELQHKDIILATALVHLESGKGNSTVLRALVDQGSQSSFISEMAASLLGLKRIFVDVSISGIGQFESVRAKGKVQCQIKISHTEFIPTEMFVLNKITSPLPIREFNISCYEHLRNIRLADPKFNKTGKIDVLLGADIYSKIIRAGIRRGSNGPIAQNTLLGWIVSGETVTSYDSRIRSFTITTSESEDCISKQLRQFWEVEELRPQRVPTMEEERCESFYQQHTTRSSDGRFTTRLPFKDEDYKQKLGSSRQGAINSLLALERRLANNSDLSAEYNKCIDEYLKLGHMFPAKDTLDVIQDNDGRTVCVANYLPHHAVIKDSSTTKVRVVFDAARKTKSGLSLNDVLLTGPSILNELLVVLLRWRLYKIVYAADVEKMFRQVNINEDDANYQRIVWRNSDSEIKDYCLATVTFGTTCAPYLAIRTLHKAAEVLSTTNSTAYMSILEDFYMDDYLSGGSTVEEALEKQTAVRNVLDSAGFKLRKWIANDKRVLQNIASNDQDNHTMLNLDWDNGLKTLGIVWYPSCDTFSYKIKLAPDYTISTKRSLLSEIARLFDPMGWLAPVVIRGKLLMQALWLSGTDWDSTLPSQISNEWNILRKELIHIETLRVPRFVQVEESEEIELHGFCDASQRAYAAVVYLVSRSKTQSHSSLIMAKTKVAPIRTITIPRLELCGAVLLAKLVKKIKIALKLPFANTYLWTDSTIVLSWLKGHPSRWSVYIANRTAEIHTEARDVVWRHVPTEENPEDIATRGINPQNLLRFHTWWNGPEWLIQWRTRGPIQMEIPTTDIEIRRSKLKCLLCSYDSTLCDSILEKFSALNKLVRVTAYCYRFATLTRKTETSKFLTTDELKRALLFWIKYTQRLAFSAEIAALENNTQIGKKSKILNLNPFLDNEGILRVGGRLEKALVNFEIKHPIILPKQSHLTMLIINQFHLSTLHGGTQLTLNLLRTKYWIVNGKQVVSQFIHQCVICFRHKAIIRSQLMGNLPSARINISRPFSHTGVDYCGPIYIKNAKGRGTVKTKGYIAIFVCLAVKAIHIELVGDLTTESFLAALKRFVSRRGLCSHLYSDGGTNFVGANAELKRVVKRNENVAENLAVNDITWHFNTPAAPHFGGLWEAGVKSIKYHLRRIVGEATMTYEELNTVLTQIEACLNSRPLCPLSEDPNDLAALTPGHFLIGGVPLAVPEDTLLDLNIHHLNRWQLTQRMTQTFWKRWSTEYLSRLQQRPKWIRSTRNIRQGDLVLVKDDRYPSYKWPLGRIMETTRGTDGRVRVVTVRTENSSLQRPATKIALLPIRDNFDISEIDTTPQH